MDGLHVGAKLNVRTDLQSFAQAGLTNTTQLYVFRLFIGLFEAAFQPVSMFLLGSWYVK